MSRPDRKRSERREAGTPPPPPRPAHRSEAQAVRGYLNAAQTSLQIAARRADAKTAREIGEIAAGLTKLQERLEASG